MTTKGNSASKNEALSALVDGECKKPVKGMIIKKIASGNDHYATWERYHLIGEAMRKGLPAQIVADCSISHRVRDALKKEPEIIRSAGWGQYLSRITDVIKKSIPVIVSKRKEE